APPPRVLLTRRQAAALPDTLNPDTPVEGIYENIPVLEIDPADPAQIAAANKLPQPVLAALPDKLPSDPVDAHRLLAARLDPRHAILLKDTLDPASEPPAAPALLSALRLGARLCDGIGDAVLLRAEPNPAAALALAYNILQAAGARVTKTEYISCPSCGRTLFDIQPAARRVREKTAHLKGLKIAVMGCIVNGPGEMAGADFGYVGGAPGKINLYAGRDCVAVNIPETEAVDRLVALIRQHGKWVEPPAPVLPAENSGASG
ncbi:MAG: flavodoxin-dependent (E)-4-hydroxy-3-methylbut-2-enyl-diphosphate synthase, partial [Opitutaceae bacterium]|nr:flavodoxin-dependent (E)-4-hydroxy-3-methylbut-2-enyl-diphosphate synthase [Opitutaceae bacterium]